MCLWPVKALASLHIFAGLSESKGGSESPLLALTEAMEKEFLAIKRAISLKETFVLFC